MSRKPRSGVPSQPVTVRVTEAEREAWQAAADASGAASLSEAIRPAITRWAIGVIELRMHPGKRKNRLLGRL